MINEEPQPAGPRSDVPQTSEEPAPGHPRQYFIEEDRTPLDMVFDAEGYPIILFDPVPMLRRRRHDRESL